MTKLEKNLKITQNSNPTSELSPVVKCIQIILLNRL